MSSFFLLLPFLLSLLPSFFPSSLPVPSVLPVLPVLLVFLFFLCCLFCLFFSVLFFSFFFLDVLFFPFFCSFLLSFFPSSFSAKLCFTLPSFRLALLFLSAFCLSRSCPLPTFTASHHRNLLPPLTASSHSRPLPMNSSLCLVFLPSNPMLLSSHTRIWTCLFIFLPCFPSFSLAVLPSVLSA